MAVKNLTGLRTTQYDITQNNVTLNIKAGAEIITLGYGVNVDAAAKNATINVAGSITAQVAGVFVTGKNAEVRIGETGTISAQVGVYLTGENASAVNNGEIDSSSGYGMVHLAPDAADLRNNGSIDGLYGMVGGGDEGRIINGAEGEIRSTLLGIVSSAGAGQQFSIVNHGSIVNSTAGPAINGGSCDDTVTNDGTISGLISLGDGNDTFDTRGGRIDSSVTGGNGDDVMIVDRGAYKLTESSGQGTDTIKSTVSYKLSENVEQLVLLGSKDIDGTGTIMGDFLLGNSGDNDIRGLAGSDHLWGRKGNDRLFGAADMDTDYFHFATGDGQDIVMDYTDGLDIIQIQNWVAITSFADLKNNHATDQGNDLLIKAGSDTLLIRNMQEADLDAMDVLIV